MNGIEAAERAALHYVSDAEPGIRRRGSGRGFYYLAPSGERITDKATLARIRALAIPPAWTDVWISESESGHIQATGIDARGRKQYRYHARWAEIRDGAKFSRLAAFAAHLPALRATVDADLRKRGLPREKVLASVVWLLDNTMIRVGNAAYARENKSFGLTTLRSRHLAIEGARLSFAFKGKSGKEWKLELTDRRIARVLKSIQELPGQHLLQYLDEDGQRRQVTSGEVNAYIRQHAAEDFSSKDFRTWGGTVRALSVLAELPVPEAVTARRVALNAAIDAVASGLGNTRSVCRRCYIHPAIVEAWEEGMLADQLAALRRGGRRDGLDPEELMTVRWLEKFAPAPPNP